MLFLHANVLKSSVRLKNKKLFGDVHRALHDTEIYAMHSLPSPNTELKSLELLLISDSPF